MFNKQKIIPEADSTYSGLPPFPEPQKTQTLSISFVRGTDLFNAGNVEFMMLTSCRKKEKKK